jgi:sulfate adenylyltransferase large subunit
MNLSVVDAKTRPAELLRFITAGSVDDGKSTLIGRLLFESKALFEDQVKAIKIHSSGAINFANLTDGLRAEREQGITIDVAYRYFSTPKRRFIIADTPGHVQYTRNMVTAASNTNLSVILVDATAGITEQTRRHTYLSHLLGIRHLVVCVNKMDLVDYAQDTFQAIRDQFLAFAKLESPSGVQFGAGATFASIDFIPISALHGDNLVLPSEKISWYSGPTLLSYLEDIEIAVEDHGAARLPIQWIIKSNSRHHERAFRGYAGQVHGGTFRVGDQVAIHPSGQRSTIRDIQTFDGSLDTASAPLSVTILLEDELDIGRGDMLTHQVSAPHVRQDATGIVCWMNEEPLKKGRTYLIKHSARSTRAKVDRFMSQVDINTLSSVASTKQSLALNDIGVVSFSATSALVYDAYNQNQLTGSFIIIDELTNATAGAGLFLDPANLPAFAQEVSLSDD